MANLYGVSNAPGLPIIINPLGGGDVVCAPGSMTVLTTSPAIIAPSQGYFYAMIWAGIELSTGAAPPTGIVIGAAIGAGSFTNQAGYDAIALAANGYYFLPYCTFTAPSQTAWQGAGSTVKIGFQTSTQSATVKNYSMVTIALFRAPDQ